MNETALPLATALAMNGDALDVLFAPFEPRMHYGDGMNLYAYLGSNPINGLDPIGLDEIDDLIDDITGQRLYALGALNEGARWASLGLQTAVGIAAALTGFDTVASIVRISTGVGGFWDAIDVVASLNPVGRVSRALSKAKRFRKLWRRGRAGAASAAEFRKFARHWKGGANSLKYHWDKHAKRFGTSVEDYTDDAMDFWKANRGRAVPHPIENQMRNGFKIRGNPGGIFTEHGTIVSFWYQKG